MHYEVHRIGSGSSKNDLVLGFVPRISIDLRIRCPRMFDEKHPAPPPPTLRYSEIATKAAFKITASVWFCRRYVEVIKVGYVLDDSSPDIVYITGDVILIVPTTAEKIEVRMKLQIGSRCNFGELELAEPDEACEKILKRLADELVRKSKAAVCDRKIEFDGYVDKLQFFQDTFKLD